MLRGLVTTPIGRRGLMMVRVEQCMTCLSGMAY